MPSTLVALGLPGGWELLVLVLIVLLVLGPSKLPQLGEGIGKMLRGFKKEMKQIDEERAQAQTNAGEDRPNDEIDVTPKSTSATEGDYDQRKRA